MALALALPFGGVFGRGGAVAAGYPLALALELAAGAGALALGGGVGGALLGRGNIPSLDNYVPESCET